MPRFAWLFVRILYRMAINMKKAWPYRLFTLLFLAICAAPALGTMAFGPSESIANESLVPAPRLQRPDGLANWAFFSDASDWFAKHFAFRRELITADSALKAALFQTSAQEQVALGKDGWLYYAETVDDYTGADALTPRQAFCAARALRLAQDWAESQGCFFAFTIAPNKISLYPQHFPGELPKGETAAQQLSACLAGQGVAYADLFAALGSSEETLYHAADSHWTNRGAALAHDALLGELGVEGAAAHTKAGSYQNTHAADLYAMLYPASPWLDKQFVWDEPLQFTYDTPVRGPDDIHIYTTSTAVANGSLLMFRDSFGNALHGLMAESFNRAFFTRATPYDLIQANEYGYVVLEIVERNIPRLAEGGFLFPAPKVQPDGVPRGRFTGKIDCQPVPGQPGYVQVSGCGLASTCPDARVYLEADGAFYEAIPTVTAEGEGFSALLPASAAEAGICCWVER